jgi:hypothetical protein
MQVWVYEIRAGNKLVKKSDTDFVTREQALAAGTKYLQDNQNAVVAEYGADNLTVTPVPQLVGGSLS